MDSHALNVLEYPKVKEMLRGYAYSTLGRDAIDELQPFTYLETALHALKEVSEMVRLYKARQQPHLDGMYDIRDIVKKSTIPEAMLEPEEILLVGETVQAADRIQSSLKKAEVDIDKLRLYAKRLVSIDEIENEIGRVFDEQKNIRDTASRELGKIRQSIRQQRASMVNRVEKLLRKTWKDYLVEDLYTVRDERYVLPVDARYQNKVKGIIHDRSSTGTTVYIEPLELVEDGNRLKELHREEYMEIRKILKGLTAVISTHAEELNRNVELFQALDTISAKARLSMEYNMEEPALLREGPVKILRGKHPLLLYKHGPENVAPLDLAMEKETRGIVISGPNTGGKTVVLKTLGLLVLMAQSGMHVPADGQTQLPVFKEIGADIGDEQSLEQSLSTFSSHMKNIREILENADAQSLVLIDELGSGTDPIEGGALSCSILEQLYKQGTTFIATTHLQDVKLFAYQTEGIANGSMDFDLQTLQPTFRFRMGLPGQSNAIQIAKRLGLPNAVIDKAQTAVKESGGSPEELLTKLGNELRKAESLRKKAESDAQKAKKQYKDNQQYKKKAEAQANDRIEKAEAKAQKMVREMEARLKDMERQEEEFKKEWKTRLDFLIQQSHETVKPDPGRSSFSHLKDEIKQTKKELQEQKKPPKQEKKPKPQRKSWRWNQLEPGARVKLEGLSETGMVKKVWADKKEIEVSISSMTLRVKTDQVLSIHPKDGKPASNVSSGSVKVERPEFQHNSCDVHGLTVDEMTPIVEKYLDEAFLNGQPYVYILHGRGMGILRRAVHNLLRDNPVVKNYRLGDEFEGGTGVTLVNMNSSVIRTKK